MKLEEIATMRAPNDPIAASISSQADLSDWVLQQLPSQGERYIATAPGRLDVVGGIAEYTGGLVVASPVAEHACAAVQRRNDEKLSIVSTHRPGGQEPDVFEISLNRLRGGNGAWIHGGSAPNVGISANNLSLCCVATIVEAFRENLFGPLSDGVSVAVATNLGEAVSASFPSACASALLVALAALSQEIIEPNVAARVAQTVENEWLGVAVGPAASLCGLVGEAGQLMHLRCDTRTLAGAMRLPNGVQLVALECGGSPPDHAEKFFQVRTATFMGRYLIDRIIQHEKWLSGQWDGHLSRISVNDFVKHYRDRLPTKMAGRQFLDLFGETGDRLTRIDPSQQYKIRSRTEHHVYEHARSRQFVEAMSRGSRNGTRSAFVEAGKAMNASHWSVGQRCGMGSVQTNSLVNRLRKAGPAGGIFGARCAGWQSGSTVVVLAEESEPARQTMEDSIQAYSEEYNMPVFIRSGSLPGAMVSGARRA